MTEDSGTGRGGAGQDEMEWVKKRRDGVGRAGVVLWQVWSGVGQGNVVEVGRDGAGDNREQVAMGDSRRGGGK